MRRLMLAVSLSVLFAAPSCLLADSIPYSAVGTIPPSFTLKATTSGEIFVYVVKAGDTGTEDFISMRDLTTGGSAIALYSNYHAANGEIIDAGFATAGDLLVFQVSNVAGTWGSDAALNLDNANHAYGTNFAGGAINGVTYPAGVYLGLEDLIVTDSDLNYNDVAFLATGVTLIPSPTGVTAVPEPGTFVMLGTGLLGAAASMRRRLFVR